MGEVVRPVTWSEPQGGGFEVWSEELSHAAPIASAAKSPSRPVREAAMSDPITRDELAARLEAIEARADTKFEKLFSEIKDARAQSAKEIAVLTSDLRGDFGTFKSEMGGKLDVNAAKAAGKYTVWGAALTVVAAIVATILVFGQISQAAYDTGVSAEQRATEAAEKAAGDVAAKAEKEPARQQR